MIANFTGKFISHLTYKHIQLLSGNSNPQHNPNIIFQNPRLSLFDAYYLQPNPYRLVYDRPKTRLILNADNLL